MASRASLMGKSSTFETDNSFEKIHVYSCEHGVFKLIKSDPASDWNVVETNRKFSIPFPEWVPNPSLLEGTIITRNRSFVCGQDRVNRIWTSSNIKSERNLAYFPCSEHEEPAAAIEPELMDTTESKTNAVFKDAMDQE